MPLPPEVNAFARGLLRGFGKVGARAITSATKSVLKDAKKVVKEVDARFQRAQERLERMGQDDDE
jgi:hypothetical protein